MSGIVIFATPLTFVVTELTTRSYSWYSLFHNIMILESKDITSNQASLLVSTHWQWFLLNDAGATCNIQRTQTLTKWTSRSLRLTSISATQVWRSWFWRVFACHIHRGSAKCTAWRGLVNTGEGTMTAECSCAELALRRRRRRSRGLLEDSTLSWDGERLFTETNVLKIIRLYPLSSWNYAFSVFNIILNKHVFISYCGILFFLFFHFYLSDEQSYFPL